MKPLSFFLALALTVFAPPLFGAKGDDLLKQYFELETVKTEESFLAGIESKEDWLAKKDKYRVQLFSMLGIDPNRSRTDLKATITGKVDGDGFVVEKLHYQSSPGLYVTGNLYLPAERKEGQKFPAILYVCGHGRVKKGGVSYGNKTHYHHHGAWFARNGYICLTIDTIQLGEIEGLHHGTYSKNMWWWASRGYTPAGVEAWNGIRGIDYLQSRPEVDGERIGVTGRSGGGAYSWWVAALDERVKAAVPVAGITSMRNHVVDGCVEGHCDCMYQVNARGWDYAMISSLVAPRSLLISNTDKDRIFPLDGVVDVHRKTKRVYDLLGVPNNLGLHVTEGPHKDTQNLRVHAFSWFNRFLKKENPLIDKPAVKYFEPEQLKVFEKLPADEITNRIHDTFVPQAEPPTVPKDKACWSAYRKATMAGLNEHVFAGWPDNPGELGNEKALDLKADGIRLAAYDFNFAATLGASPVRCSSEEPLAQRRRPRSSSTFSTRKGGAISPPPTARPSPRPSRGRSRKNFPTTTPRPSVPKNACSRTKTGPWPMSLLAGSVPQHGPETPASATTSSVASISSARLSTACASTT